MPDRDWRRLFNYLQQVGVQEVWRKVQSRRKERLRNEKFLAFGAGRISERDEDAALQIGESVVFVAPCHPRCVERLVLPAELVRPTTSLSSEKEQIVYLDASHLLDSFTHREALAGWCSFSGRMLEAEALDQTFAQLEQALQELDMTEGQHLPLRRSAVHERSAKSNGKNGNEHLQAVVFGCGHYAKTICIANLDPAISVAKVHEIDPCQLGPADQFPYGGDSSPLPREDEQYDLYCVASYHHTHTPLAVHALRTGASVIVEKPVVTTWGQLENLLDAMEDTSGRLFTGFHKRYLPFNDHIRTDLGIGDDEPISYHCIVYEIKLPALHWYRWPNSGSGVVSNGCHWIDHFMYLNHFSPATYYDAWEMGNGDVLCLAELENGAVFSMALTQHGSPRIGNQYYEELRANDVTVRIRNDSSYFAEDSRRVLRKRSINKMSVYTQMYRTISKRIVTGTPGETRESVLRSAGLMLSLEDKLNAKRG